MNIALHPALACLWALVTVALGVDGLMAQRWNWRSPMTWWLWVATEQNMIQWAASIYNHPLVNYYAFWLAQAILHILVLAAAGQYAWACLRKRRRLPPEFAAWAAIAMVTVAGTDLAVRLWGGMPVADGLLQAEHVANLAVCGLLWLVLLACRGDVIEESGRMLVGFAGLYSAGLVTAGLRLCVPSMATREACWFTDFTVQLACCGWWGWVLCNGR